MGLREPARAVAAPFRVGDDPLRRERADFVDAVRHNRQPAVTGRAGRAALALATLVAEKM